jgi:hypothetical protein
MNIWDWLLNFFFGRTSMPEKTIIITDALQNEVVGSLTYDGASQTALFKAETKLSPNTNYHGKVTVGVKDLSGNSMVSEFNWSFTTGQVVDVDPPIVLSVSPADGETDVPLEKDIAITFSEPMDPATLIG